jgi:hypothetical protein
MTIRRSAFPALLAVMVMTFAAPSFANKITAATGDVTCSNYSLTFTFIDLKVSTPPTPYTVEWSITLTPSSGPALTITGSTPLTATSASQTLGPVTTTFSKAFASALSGPYTVSGTATLIAPTLTTTVDISFTPPTLSCVLGRFTGGGKEIDVGGAPMNVAITEGLELDCDLMGSQNLEINWLGNQFHLEDFTFAACSFVSNPAPPKAPVNTMNGEGTGKYDQTDGYTIVFTLVDNGEPGVNDTACFEIYSPAAAATLNLTGNPTCDTLHSTDPGDILDLPSTHLTFGNIQAHPDQH